MSTLESIARRFRQHVEHERAKRKILADECRECGGDSKVIRTRRPKRLPICRRRECVACGHRWNTTEQNE